MRATLIYRMNTSTETDQQSKSVRIAAEYHDRLVELADLGHRDLGAQVEYLIAKELKRLGLVPDEGPSVAGTTAGAG